MNKKSRNSRPRRNRHQKAYLKQPNNNPNIATPYPQYSNSGGNGAHWFGRLPPNLQCILGLALIALVGVTAHDHTMSSDLFNVLTLIIYMFK